MLESPTGWPDKKLKAAAQYWLQGDTQAELAAEMQAWGGDANLVDPDDFRVHPDNWSAVNAFLLIDHCWHYTIDGRRRRIDWQDAQFVLSKLDVELPRDVFEKIYIIEEMVREA